MDTEPADVSCRGCICKLEKVGFGYRHVDRWRGQLRARDRFDVIEVSNTENCCEKVIAG